MELKIEDLVSSIKKEGIDAANAEAERIIAEANKKARSIVEEAEKERAKIKEQTENEVAILKESAKVNALQAQRDAVLLFEDAVKNKFTKLLEADIKKCVSGEALTTLIKAAINGEKPSGYTAEISEVCAGLRGELAKEIKDGLEIKISPSVKTGFKLCAKDGSGYFDCSDKEIFEMLSPFFSNLDI